MGWRQILITLIGAYRNARTLGELYQDVRMLVEKCDDLKRLPGIGDDLSAKIREIAATGSGRFL